MVACYLVTDDRGVTVVDTGLPGQYQELVDELATMDRTADDIRAVVLTHGDSDHLGFAEKLRSEHDVEVFVHEKDAALTRGETKKENPPWGSKKLGPMLGFLWYAARRGGMKVTPVAEVTTVRGDETIDLPGSPRIIHIPGHSPGSIAIYFPEITALCVGDALTTRHVLTGVEGPQPAPFTLDEQGALASLAKLEDLDTSWVLPGHGPPWQGEVAEVVRRIREIAASRDASAA